MKKSIIRLLAVTAMLAAPVCQISAVTQPVVAAASQGASAGKSAKKYVVTANMLYVRSGPSTDDPVIGSLSRGMEVKVVSISSIEEKGNRWAKIRFAGLTAYVSRNYLAKK